MTIRYRRIFTGKKRRKEIKQQKRAVPKTLSDGQEYLSSLKIIRRLTKAPVLVVDRRYGSTEKTAAIKAGADEYFKWSDSYPEETVASGLALIRRYTELNQTKQQPFHMITRGILRIIVDYHKVLSIHRKWSFPGMSVKQHFIVDGKSILFSTV